MDTAFTPASAVNCVGSFGTSGVVNVLVITAADAQLAPAPFSARNCIS